MTLSIDMFPGYGNCLEQARELDRLRKLYDLERTVLDAAKVYAKEHRTGGWSGSAFERLLEAATVLEAFDPLSATTMETATGPDEGRRD